MTSGQETERVYSYNTEDHTGLSNKDEDDCRTHIGLMSERVPQMLRNPYCMANTAL